MDAYEVLGAEKGWTREEAESEVVRYLQRQSLAIEGGVGGQDYGSFGLLAVLFATVAYNSYEKWFAGS